MKIFYLEKEVGEVINKVFVSHRNPIHFFRNFNGFGISMGVIDRLEGLKVQDVLIVFHNTDQVEYYKTTVDKFMIFGHNWTNEEIDEQLILSLNHFELIETRQLSKPT